MAADAVRNESVAVLVALPLTAGLCSGAARALSAKGAVPSRSPARWFVAVSALLLILAVSHPALFPLSPDPRVATPQAWPVSPARALPSGCRLLNEYQDGGYLIYGRPDILVSQDGRNDLYGRTILGAERARVYDPRPVSELRLFGQDVTCVLVRHQRPLAHALASSPGWRKVAAVAGVEAWVQES